jgi:hypothetical protein
MGDGNRRASTRRGGLLAQSGVWATDAFAAKLCIASGKPYDFMPGLAVPGYSAFFHRRTTACILLQTWRRDATLAADRRDWSQRKRRQTSALSRFAGRLRTRRRSFCRAARISVYDACLASRLARRARLQRGCSPRNARSLISRERASRRLRRTGEYIALLLCAAA